METYYVAKLKEKLTERQRENPKYSLRAFARDLAVHSSSLAQVMKYKRSLPFKNALSIVTKLNLNDSERTLFMESFYRSKTNIDNIKISPLDERKILDESYYNIIAQWEHFAVLELFDLSDFTVTRESIQQAFGLTSMRAEVVIANLEKSKLIKEVDGKFEKLCGDIRTTEDIKSQALKDSHLETLKLGINKLEEIEVELRDFSSTTVAIDPEKLPEAKTIIREFRQKMAALLRDGQKQDVYQLAIQFYPLTIKSNLEHTHENTIH